jgi:hypothetical protein
MSTRRTAKRPASRIAEGDLLANDYGPDVLVTGAGRTVDGRAWLTTYGTTVTLNADTPVVVVINR